MISTTADCDIIIEVPRSSGCITFFHATSSHLSCENEKEDIITRNSLYVALCHSQPLKMEAQRRFPSDDTV
eukprot:scaffold1005_cov96-Skeletonema_marinoi.AAC.1